MPHAIFAIPQVVNLVVPETATARPLRMNYPMNRTDFRLLRGVTNEVQFFVRDIDRKPFVSADTYSIIVTDERADRLLLRKDLVVEDAQKALFRVTFGVTDVQDLPDGFLRWSIVRTDTGGRETMLWTDRDYSPFSYLRMGDGPFPPPVAPEILDPNDFIVVDSYRVSSALIGATNAGWPGAVQTFVFPLNEFVGEIIIEATLEQQPPNTDGDWFEAGRIERTEAATENAALTVEDSVMWLRLRLRIVAGSVEPISYRR